MCELMREYESMKDDLIRDRISVLWCCIFSRSNLLNHQIKCFIFHFWLFLPCVSLARVNLHVLGKSERLCAMLQGWNSWRWQTLLLLPPVPVSTLQEDALVLHTSVYPSFSPSFFPSLHPKSCHFHYEYVIEFCLFHKPCICDVFILYIYQQ